MFEIDESLAVVKKFVFAMQTALRNPKKTANDPLSGVRFGRKTER